MKVAMLAAGVGSRLDAGPSARPKALLRFAGKSLLQRHLEILLSFGLDDITIVVGHRAADIERELAAIGAADLVRTRFNPDYQASSLLSLWTLREVLAAGAPVLYMDADVLYDRRLLARLLDSPHDDCLLIDRDAELSEESVKVCVRGDQVVDFHKRVRASRYDYSAEWVGFARFAPPSAARLVRAIQGYVETGRTDVIYEEAMRDLILAQGGRFGLVDSAGLPWIEIDFPEDLERARHLIQPQLIDGPAARAEMGLGPIEPPWDQRLARALVRPLRRSRVTPNAITTVALAVGLLAAWLFALGGSAAHLGALLFILACLLDHADGELARMTGQTSAFGHYYDLVTDATVHAALFIGIGIGLSAGEPGAPFLGLGLLAGGAVGLIVILRLELERRAGRAATRQPNLLGFELQDVTYLLGPVTWLGDLAPVLLLTAIGAPIYLLAVLWSLGRHLQRARGVP